MVLILKKQTINSINLIIYEISSLCCHIDCFKIAQVYLKFLSLIYSIKHLNEEYKNIWSVFIITYNLTYFYLLARKAYYINSSNRNSISAIEQFQNSVFAQGFRYGGQLGPQSYLAYEACEVGAIPNLNVIARAQNDAYNSEEQVGKSSAHAINYEVNYKPEFMISSIHF